MSETFEERLDSIDSAALTPLVRNALNLPHIVVSDWTYHPLKIGGGQFFGVAGMVRFSGRALDSSSSGFLEWSMILKAFRGGAESNILRHSTSEVDEDTDESVDIRIHDYWKREVLTYQSGLLETLPKALAHPRCYGVVEYPGDAYWVWMEDLGEVIQEQWPLEWHGLAAKLLGRFNGAYLCGKPIPTEPWLGRGRTEGMLERAAPQINKLEQWSQEPVVHRWLGEGGLERVQVLWSKRDRLLNGLQALPQCLCHHDAYCRNLVLRQEEHDDETMFAIDWAMVGTGAVGEELSALVAATLYFLDVEAKDAQKLDKIVFDGYMSGLRDAGWNGNARLARLGYTASTALWAGIGSLAYVEYFVNQPELLEGVRGQPFDRIMVQMAEMQYFLLDLGDEALYLLDELG